MQEIWIVWEYDSGFGPEVYVYDVFTNENEANKCAAVMNSKPNGLHYEIEKFNAHSRYIPDND